MDLLYRCDVSNVKFSTVHTELFAMGFFLFDDLQADMLYVFTPVENASRIADKERYILKGTTVKQDGCPEIRFY